MKAIIRFLAISVTLACVSTPVCMGQTPLILSGTMQIDVSDHVCNDSVHLCDAPYNDCSSSDLFYVDHDGFYTIEVDLECTDPAYCGKCMACVHIMQGNTATCFRHTVCQSNVCSNSVQCPLVAGLPYSLVVCKRVCTGYYCVSCTCSAAHAKIHP